jgi:ribose transport system substrate-binding protein
MTSRRDALLSLLVVPLVASCGKKSSGGPPATGGPLKIAVIPKGTTHEFWKSVHAGVIRASKNGDSLELIWKGPLKEDDLKSQIDIVQSMVAQGVAGILLAPLNDKALVNPVKAAMDAKIPVVIFDSALQGSDFVSFVGTDNNGAGVKAGQHLAQAMGGKGKLLVLRYQEGSASTTAREEGFLSAVRGNFKDITIVSDRQYGGATTESAFAAAENLLSANKAAEGGVDAVFCPNESTTFGMLLALQKAKLAGKVKLVGFDASDKLIQGLRDGQIDALVLQDPMMMGDLGLRTLIGAIHGQKASPVQDTGSRVVTRADLDNPEVQGLIHPDLKKWLGE